MNDRPPVTNAEIVQALRKNWRAEKESAQLYRELAGSEKDTKRKAVLLRLAEAEERHAARWEKRLSDVGERPPTISGNLKSRLSRWINRHVGSDVAIRRLAAAWRRRRRETKPGMRLSRNGRSPATPKLRRSCRNSLLRRRRTQGCCKTCCRTWGPKLRST